MTNRELDAFYLALDENPADALTPLALADWYDEHGRPQAAECLRWSAQRGRRPFLYRRQGNVLRFASNVFHDGWYWWTLESQYYGDVWGYPAECRLPSRLWEPLPHSFPYSPSVFKQYPTRRAAYEALFAAWPAYRRRN